MAIEYIDKEHNDGLQQYIRRDNDGTSGGSVHGHDRIGMDQILLLSGPGQFRIITETNGVVTISARSQLDEVINFVEEIDRQIQPEDGPAPITDEWSGFAGFGSGDFNQGGFGGMLP